MNGCTDNEPTVFYPLEFDRDELEALYLMAQDAFIESDEHSFEEHQSEQIMNKIYKTLYPID